MLILTPTKEKTLENLHKDICEFHAATHFRETVLIERLTRAHDLTKDSVLRHKETGNKYLFCGFKFTNSNTVSVFVRRIFGPKNIAARKSLFKFDLMEILEPKQ